MVYATYDFYLLIKYRYRIDIAIFWQYRIDIVWNSKSNIVASLVPIASPSVVSHRWSVIRRYKIRLSCTVTEIRSLAYSRCLSCPAI